MRFLFTPEWFLGQDVVINIFSFLVLSAFFILCWKYYRLNKKKPFLYLGIGFLLIALAQLAMIFTKIGLYYDTTFTRQIGKTMITFNVIKSVDIFYQLALLFHKFFTLLGFYILYKLPLKKIWTGDSYLVLFFIIIISVYSSQVYYIFHITALIFLILILKNYFSVYSKNKNYNTAIFMLAFSMLALSQIMFVLSGLEKIFVLADIIELASYLTLLFLIIRIIRKK